MLKSTVRAFQIPFAVALAGVLVASYMNYAIPVWVWPLVGVGLVVAVALSALLGPVPKRSPAPPPPRPASESAPKPVAAGTPLRAKGAKTGSKPALKLGGN